MAKTLTFENRVVSNAFLEIYGQPPVSADYRHMKMPSNAFNTARVVYAQWLDKFLGVVDYSSDARLGRLVENVKQFAGLGRVIIFRRDQGGAGITTHLAFPDFVVEDGFNKNNPLVGLRPIVTGNTTGLLNPGSLLLSVQSNLISRGIPVANPHPQLPSGLLRKNAKNVEARFGTLEEALNSLPLVGAKSSE